MVVGSDSAAHEKKIDLGAREADKVQVAKGLEPGEKVITGGGVGLEDGAKVRIAAAPADKGDKDDKGGKEDKDDKAAADDKK